MQSTIITHQMPTLHYGLGDLAPQISEETMRYHYGKHLATYIDNLNALILGTKFEMMPLEEIVRRAEVAIFNNAAQAWNHIFYFATLAPNPKSTPTGVLGGAINREFGSFESLRTLLLQAGTAIFGSGWVWLCKDKHSRLSIVPTQGADNPMCDGLTPLLTLDVWEHAYYIDFRNRRAEALAAAWERIDWRIVEERFR